MTAGTLIAACGVVTAMLTALAALGVAGRWVWQTGRKLARLADDLTGEPARPGMPNGRPGVLDRLSSMEDGQTAQLDRLSSIEERLLTLGTVESRLGAVEAQLKPNGGGSLRDAVDMLKPAEQVAA
jgi:hypothetical protein